MNPQDLIAHSRRIVFKIGSAIVTDEKSGCVRQEWLSSVASDIAGLMKQGKQVVVVTSGAIALGRASLGISYTDRPSGIPLEMKQAAAAIGQVHLASSYEKALSEFGVHSAQVLLTPRDTEDRRSH